jgi:hypothetical protein
MALSDNARLARALGAAAHPLRVDLLDAFTSGLVHTETEAALVLGHSVAHTRHHINQLVREGFLLALSTEPDTSRAACRYEPTERARVLVDALTTLT